MAHVEMQIDSVRQAAHATEWVVLLKEQRAERYLPIYVGSPQAEAIKQALMGTPSPESADDALSLSGIDVPLSRVESASVVVKQFEDNAFNARLLLTYQGRPYSFVYPTVRALVLGMRAGARIFVEEQVLDEAGITVTV